MPTFLLISKHSPENCWRFNEAAKNMHLDLIRNLDELLKKHNIRLVGCWFDLQGHAMYEVYDAPSLEAFQNLAMEPAIVRWSAFNTMEIKLVSTIDDVMKILGLS